MICLNGEYIKRIPVSWTESIEAIENAVKCLKEEDFAQPIKPYLRYRDQKNRIIAMPAFIGGNFDVAGIKWIASFPDNIKMGIPRAHSVTVLNDSQTGEPLCIINTAQLSIVRTASVSGTIIKKYLEAREKKNIICGIIGWGPIGRHHYKMIKEVYDDVISEIRIFDIKDIDDLTLVNDTKLKVVNSWEEAYNEADIFITCTVSSERYIDIAPKKGSLHLNVSLRDYKSMMSRYFEGAIVVDEWEEICRENTDIENFHNEAGLEENDVYEISDVIVNSCFQKIDKDAPIMFNPMGMAIFDIAVSSVYYRKAINENIGIVV